MRQLNRRRLTPVLTGSMIVGGLTVGLLVNAPEPGAGSVAAYQDLIAKDVQAVSTFLPAKTTSADARATRHGVREWRVHLGNRSRTQTTKATIALTSGYDPKRDRLRWRNRPVSAFPVTVGRSTLRRNQELAGALVTNIPATYSLGYNSTRRVSASRIPPGGANQKVTVTVTAKDSRYAETGNVSGRIMIAIGSDRSGVALRTASKPTNLSKHELLETGRAPGALFQWKVDFVRLNKTYTFSAVLHVPNRSKHAITYWPFARISGSRVAILCAACSGSSATIPDATLDGKVAGSGSVTFSVDETTHTWTNVSEAEYGITYAGTP